jgi:membrane protein
MRGIVARFKDSRLGRSMERYSRMRGDVLAGGVAYQGLMSIGAAVVLVSTATAFVVGRAPSLRDAMLGFLDRAIPGIVDSGTVGGGGLIDASSLSAGPVTGIVSALAVIVGLNTASRWVGALRASTRAMLGSESASPLHGKARDVVALVALGVIALLAAALQVAAASAAAWLGPDHPGRTWVARGAALALVLAADAFFLFIALAVLGGAGRPYRRLLPAIAAATIGIAVLRSASTLLLGASVGNPILAPFAAVITVLVWVDLVTRVVLLAAAWVGAEGSVRVT